jgi:uncharacterized protein
MAEHPSRRDFLQSSVAAGVALSLADSLLAAQKDSGQGLPTRPLGKTGIDVSIVGLGGWDIGKLGKDDGDEAAVKLMHEALDEGISFFDNCWDYHDGYAEEVMGKGIDARRDKVFLMTKNCERDYAGSLKCLEDSLRRMKTDHVDLWQFHEMVYDNDPDWVFEKGGIKAALEAQKAGKVRFIGFTGHKDPHIHLKMLDKDQHWDSAQMPINICDWHFRSFQQMVVPVCLDKGTGVIGMKSLGGSYLGKYGKIPHAQVATGPECIHYALSQPVSVLVCGIRSRKDLDQALGVGRGFKPMSPDEMDKLRVRVKDVALDGRHEMFKTSKVFDGPHHRKQHGFDTQLNG